MSSLSFARAELAAAVTRGVSQCVIIGSHSWREALETSASAVQLFDSMTPEVLTAKLDKWKATLFVWLGGAGAQTADAVLATLTFIASMPKGSGVLFDYVVERSSPRPSHRSPLDALASRLPDADSFKYLIDPQAVTAMLQGLGFRHIADLPLDANLPTGPRLVSALL